MLCFKRPAIRPTSTLFTYDPEKPWCQGHQRQALFKCRRSLSYPPHRRNNTTDWALSRSLQTLRPYRAVLMSRAQLEGAGAEAQSVHKGPTCSFPRNILVCVHGTAPSVYNWSPEWTLGLTNLIPLKMVLCWVLLTWCLFFYFFLGRESGRGLWSTVSHVQLHFCTSGQINAGGMWWRHKRVVESQVPSNKCPGCGFIFRLFWTQSYAPYMVRATVIVTQNFPAMPIAQA